MDFSDKTVLVTGGSRGIGRAIARAFAASGARVAIIYHSNKAAAELALTEFVGQGHLAMQADVASPAAVEQAVNAIVDEFGSLDIAVNNAGIGVYHPLETTDYASWQEAWRKTIDTNLLGPANVCF